MSSELSSPRTALAFRFTPGAARRLVWPGLSLHGVGDSPTGEPLVAVRRLKDRRSHYEA